MKYTLDKESAKTYIKMCFLEKGNNAVVNFIDKIYEDFDSRKCDTCIDNEDCLIKKAVYEKCIPDEFGCTNWMEKK